jgi:hypothetical protein
MTNFMDDFLGVAIKVVYAFVGSRKRQSKSKGVHAKGANERLKVREGSSGTVWPVVSV